MKITQILFVFASLFLVTSCSQIREATETIAGEITEYQADYTFQTDRIAGSNYKEQVEDYMRSNNWLLTSEETNSLHFEQATGDFEEDTTRRFEDGSADFRFDEGREIIELNLRLRGNYNYGTKENSLEIFNDLRDALYDQ